MQKNFMRGTFLITASIVASIATLLPAASAAVVSVDSVTVGSASGAAGTTVNIPIYIRDMSGTPLGIDQPAGSRIQSYSLKINYAPTAPVQSASITRGGITTSLTPTFESTPSGAGTVSLLDTFQESSNLIPFTSNAAAPGNQVAILHLTLAPTATVGSVITLTIDPTLTQLTDQAGSGATKESVAGGNLTLINGAVTVTGDIPALSTWALILLAVSLAVVGVRMRT